MKKSILAIILVVAVILAFLLGMHVKQDNQGDNNKASVVGVYKTDSWNGKAGTLVLYEDGTCQYPSGENAKWVLNEDVVFITIEEGGRIYDGSIKNLQVFVNDNLSDASARSLGTIFAKMNNVFSVVFAEGDNENERYFQITLIESEIDSKTYNAISQIDGVKKVQNIVPEEIVNASEHEAKIMENGLVLHGQFFEKVSN